jgi:hypothetical protein
MSSGEGAIDQTAPVVLVDARNVMRSRWPNIPERRFLELTQAWTEREGVTAIVVFDGAAPGGLVGVYERDDRSTIVGAGRESADDWIALEAPRLAAEGRRVWLVSSDRGLRARVSGSVDRLIGGGEFATQLEALGAS